MGVLIRSEEVSLVTNRELHDILHYVMCIDWGKHTSIKNDKELTERTDKYIAQIKSEHGINKDITLPELTLMLGDTLNGAVLKKLMDYFGEESGLSGVPDTDMLYERVNYFPHWYGRTVWDGTNEKISPKHNVIGFTPSGKDVSVDMSYIYYGHLREMISKTFLGVIPRQVWRLPVHQAYKTNTFKRNIYFLVNGSDCEGVIVPEVARQIASSLCSDRARKVFHENNSEYDNEYFDELANVFADASANGKSIVFG